MREKVQTPGITTRSSDVFALLARLPKGKSLVFGVGRSLVATVLASMLWYGSVADEWCKLAVAKTATGVARTTFPAKTVEEPVRDGAGAGRVATATLKEVNESALHPNMYFNVIVPLLILLAFPLKPIGWTALKAFLAALLVGTADVTVAVIEAYVQFSQEMATYAATGVRSRVSHITDDRMLLYLTLCYCVVPLVATVTCHACVTRFREDATRLLWSWRDHVRARNAPRVGRNQLCPCGSGLKHKKCCGRS